MAHISPRTKSHWPAAIIAASLSLFPSMILAETVVSPAEFGPLNEQGIPQTMDGFQLASSGTGFFISFEGHFVTPFHVAGHCRRLAILRPERAYEAQIVVADAAADLVVLRSDAPHFSAELTMGKSSTPGASLTITRFNHLGGFAGRSTVLAWYVQTIHKPPLDIAMAASEPIFGGNSGSPAVRVGGGVAAMVTAVAQTDRTIALGIDAGDIAAFLSKNRIPFRWQRSPVSSVIEQGGAEQFTFPVVCYVSPVSSFTR